MTTSTPWGPAQQSKAYGRDITFYSTAGHGGFRVAPSLLPLMPDYLRAADRYADGNAGWFEEDCAWSLVVSAFPDRFDEKTRENAKCTFRNTYPNEYEKFYNVRLQPGESHARDEELFLEAHVGDYLVLSAFGDWHARVPKGYVALFARRGGASDLRKDDKWFLVLTEEYQRQGGHFVCRPEIHQEIAPIQ